MSIEIIQAGSKYLKILEEKGCSVEVTQDFEAVPALAKEAGRDYQLPTFCVERVDHTRNSTFWAVLRQHGEPIASAAAILQPIGDEPFDQYLKRVANTQYPNPSGSTLSSISPILRSKVSGKLVYIGELGTKQAVRGDRKRLSCFMRLIQVLALVEWDFDWSYAFIPHRHLVANLDYLYGFTQRLPCAQTWVDPVPDMRSSAEWWVGVSGAEMKALLSAELRSADIL